MSERMQYGGDHYETSDGYEHWDWVTDLKMHYLPATATKYVARWRKKNGIEDLKKSKTYLEKWRVCGLPSFTTDLYVVKSIASKTRKFCISSNLNELETEFMMSIAIVCSSKSYSMFHYSNDILDKLIEDAKRPV